MHQEKIFGFQIELNFIFWNPIDLYRCFQFKYIFFRLTFHIVDVNFRFSVPSSVWIFFSSGQSIGSWPSYGLVTMECQSQGKTLNREQVKVFFLPWSIICLEPDLARYENWLGMVSWTALAIIKIRLNNTLLFLAIIEVTKLHFTLKLSASMLTNHLNF